MICGIINPYLNAAAATGGSFLFDGVDDYMELGSVGVENVPISLAMWFKPDAAPDAQTILSLSSVATRRHALENLNNTQSTMKVESVGSTGTARGATAPGNWTAGAWQHFGGSLAATNTSKCYLNGTPGSTGLSGSDFTGLLSKTIIGCGYNGGSRFGFAAGLGAHAAIWNIILSDAEFASLATPGTLPTSVQSGNLVFYAPLTGGVAVDTISGNPLTISGAVTNADSPF